MSKFIIISPIGLRTPHTFESFEKVFRKNGHSYTNDLGEADVVILDGHSGLFDYDMGLIDLVIEKKLPIAWFDQLDYFSGGGYRYTFFERIVDEKESSWVKVLRKIMDNNLLAVYFMRKMSKEIKYPKNFYPYELIQYPDCDFPLTTADELFSRPYDFASFWNKATPRNNLCSGLAKHFKCDFRLGEQKLEHGEWLNRHRQSKFFLECGGGGESGGGFNSERAYQLITISPMLKCRSNQLIKNDFIDMEDCLYAGDELGVVSEQDIQKIKSVLNDKEKLFDIYVKGVEKIHKYFNADYRANYILDVLKQNNVV